MPSSSPMPPSSTRRRSLTRRSSGWREPATRHSGTRRHNSTSVCPHSAKNRNAPDRPLLASCAPAERPLGDGPHGRRRVCPPARPVPRQPGPVGGPAGHRRQRDLPPRRGPPPPPPPLPAGGGPVRPERVLAPALSAPDLLRGCRRVRLAGVADPRAVAGGARHHPLFASPPLSTLAA